MSSAARPGPQYPVTEFASWPAGAGRYVEDRTGAVWYAGCTGRWARMTGDRAAVEARIRAGELRGAVTGD